ncbi:MBL fold metallo-hydrolase [Hazenella coriacea]|uniref:Glyoxylase-like metal-dependent hydrolase (Beta-lactamase superfamily II) n=1 Tax=Hazenella coriacea TaxID=1179467 RepID=A0A4R3L2Q6_9BACL|nr:MBL fold metallo-hydrolase [Hazenella coriacea]TCS93138.1 glyoxylase-like metal-dependent hydrolase (beta-lactamase superfamily II) [Hazenella coriacea]
MPISYRSEQVIIFQSPLYQTNSTIVITNDIVLVVDPTWLPHEVDEIHDEVERIRENRQLVLLFTHSDFDHILGAGAFPEATTIAHQLFNQFSEVKKAEILDTIQQFDQKYYLERTYPNLFPQVDHPISKDGQTIRFGQTTLTFYQTPGHTPDGVFCIVEPLGIWIAGDYLSDVEFPFIYDSFSAYQKTLIKAEIILKQHSIRLLVPGHGQFTTDPNEMNHRCEQSKAYLKLLTHAVKTNQLHLLDQELKHYRFRSGLISSHESNIQLIKKELGL